MSYLRTKNPANGAVAGGPVPKVVLVDAPFSMLDYFGYFVVLFATYVLSSRFFDTVVSLAPLHIPMLFLSTLVLLTILSGRIFQLLQSKAAILLVILITWMFLASVFSYWRMGSLYRLMDTLRGLIVTVAMVCFVQNYSQLRRIAFSIGLGALTACLFFFLFERREIAGRYALAVGNYADPNEFSMAILMGLPLLYLYFGGSGRWHWKVLALAATPPIIYVFFMTGSRGGLVALVAMVAAMFFQVRGLMGRVVITGSAVMAFTVGLLVIPDMIRTRLLSMIDTSSALIDQSGAVSSSASRLFLLRKSVEFSIAHPVFGVGPGNFVNVLHQQNVETTGMNGLVQLTHNTYTQSSSETGMPGLIALLFLLGYCWKQSFYGWKKIPDSHPEKAKIRQLGILLNLSFTGVMVGCFFLSALYNPLIYITTGTLIVFDLLLARDLAAFKSTAAAGQRLQVRPISRPAVLPSAFPVRQSRLAGRLRDSSV